jgi:hypothetical protein
LEPSEIKRLLESAERALNTSRSEPDAFVLAYIAWEAFQIRVLLVGLAAQGFSVSDSKKQLKERDVWNGEKRKTVFEEIFGSKPANTKHVGRYYSKLGRHKTLRDAYVHGSARVAPKRFEAAARELIDVIGDAGWETGLAQVLSNRGLESSFTNPLGVIRRSRPTT